MLVNDAFKLVQHAFRSGRPGHAYLLVGSPRGSAGELALRLVQMLFCTSAEFESCGECHACLACAAHTAVDVMWVESALKSRMISADQMRDVRKEMLQTSYAGGWKVCVLLGAERMSESGANAFLKVLEEPPPRTLFLLLSDSPQSLLTTIVSRCQKIDVLGADSPTLDAEWREPLLDILSEHRLGSMSGMATGGKIVALLSGMKKVAEKIVLDERDDEVVDEARDVIDARIKARYIEMRLDLLRFLEGWYRDILLLVVGADPETLHNADKIDVLRERSTGYSVRQALGFVKIAENVARQLGRNLMEAEVFGYWMGRLP